jgi:hypothetical protein
MLGKRRPGDFARNRTLLGVLVVGLIVVIGGMPPPPMMRRS